MPLLNSLKGFVRSKPDAVGIKMVKICLICLIFNLFVLTNYFSDFFDVNVVVNGITEVSSSENFWGLRF